MEWNFNSSISRCSFNGNNEIPQHTGFSIDTIHKKIRKKRNSIIIMLFTLFFNSNSFRTKHWIVENQQIECRENPCTQICRTYVLMISYYLYSTNSSLYCFHFNFCFQYMVRPAIGYVIRFNKNGRIWIIIFLLFW